MLSNASTLLIREEVMGWFDNKENFVVNHSMMQNEEVIKHLVIE